MAEEIKRKAGPAKRFGVRYGRTIREKVDSIEKIYKAKHRCPYCSKETVKRLSVGIWNCKSCGSKFTGAAYDLKKEVKTEAVGQ
jgi:large subunit ribosomal protein L37Ae